MRKLFKKDQKILEEMLQLRQQGWSLQKLARKYNCGSTSIKYQCDKFLGKEKSPVVKKEGEIVHKKQKPRVYNRVGHCSVCQMKMSSEYHILNPCKT